MVQFPFTAHNSQDIQTYGSTAIVIQFPCSYIMFLSTLNGVIFSSLTSPYNSAVTVSIRTIPWNFLPLIYTNSCLYYHINDVSNVCGDYEIDHYIHVTYIFITFKYHL